MVHKVFEHKWSMIETYMVCTNNTVYKVNKLLKAIATSCINQIPFRLAIHHTNTFSIDYFYKGHSVQTRLKDTLAETCQIPNFC